MVAGLQVVGVGTASAAVKTETVCGKKVCTRVMHDARHVYWIETSTRDGGKATLRAFVGNYHDSWPNVNRFKFGIGADFPNSEFACGGLTRPGQPEENACVELVKK